MISILGRGLILLSLLVCAVGTPVGFIAGARRSTEGLKWTRRAALAFAVSMIGANLLMEYALISHDFSVKYVASVGSRSTPLHITIVSLWSSLEGSILFWGAILALFTAGVAILQRRGHEDYLAYTLAIMLAVGVFFSFLIAGPADPFAPTPLPIPLDGPGPNPLLQNHLLMIIHPPMLYGGYVGMTAPFAMAMAALLRGQLGSTWLKPLRNWLMVPWVLLTLGIMLGGWWAYEVLGWGGYWAWDPVENASFLPWLSATAALHAAVVQQRRGILKGWTVTLIAVTFLLTILGTFMTRSGVFNSVHSFTQSPIGPTFLVFLGVSTIASVILLAMKVDVLSSEPSNESLMSRESVLYVNNLLLLAVLFTVLVGTVFPLIAEAVRGIKVSVGEPYFNRMAVPLFMALTALMALGLALPWGGGKRRRWSATLGGLVLGAVLALAFGVRNILVFLTIAFAVSGLAAAGLEMLRPGLERSRKAKGGFFGELLEGMLRAPRRTGAHLAHLGLMITVIAIAVSSVYALHSEVTLSLGQSTEIGDYTLTFSELRNETHPHMRAEVVRLDVARGGKAAGFLDSALNHYERQMQPIGAPAVRSSLTHDLYATVMTIEDDGSVGLRLLIRPLVLWVWVGPIIISLGGLLCLFPARRRKASKVESP